MESAYLAYTRLEELEKPDDTAVTVRPTSVGADPSASNRERAGSSSERASNRWLSRLRLISAASDADVENQNSKRRSELWEAAQRAQASQPHDADALESTEKDQVCKCATGLVAVLISCSPAALDEVTDVGVALPHFWQEQGKIFFTLQVAIIMLGGFVGAASYLEREGGWGQLSRMKTPVRALFVIGAGLAMPVFPFIIIGMALFASISGDDGVMRDCVESAVFITHGEEMENACGLLLQTVSFLQGGMSSLGYSILVGLLGAIKAAVACDSVGAVYLTVGCVESFGDDAKDKAFHLITGSMTFELKSVMTIFILAVCRAAEIISSLGSVAFFHCATQEIPYIGGVGAPVLILLLTVSHAALFMKEKSSVLGAFHAPTSVVFVRVAVLDASATVLPHFALCAVSQCIALYAVVILQRSLMHSYLCTLWLVAIPVMWLFLFIIRILLARYPDGDTSEARRLAKSFENGAQLRPISISPADHKRPQVQSFLRGLFSHFGKLSDTYDQLLLDKTVPAKIAATLEQLAPPNLKVVQSEKHKLWHVHEDWRVHPAMVCSLSAIQDATLEDIELEDIPDAFQGELERKFFTLLASMVSDMWPTGVQQSEEKISAKDGTEIKLEIHKPSHVFEPLPCVLHFNCGKGIGIEYGSWWCSMLASLGVVVVHVATSSGFRVHPHDIEDADCCLQWTFANLQNIGASHIVIEGASTGGRVCLALTLKAKQDGTLERIKGVWVACPAIASADDVDSYSSLREFDGYLMDSSAYVEGVKRRYQGNVVYRDSPICFPSQASLADLEGLPPHIISINELDPLRDEGIAYARKLTTAGVDCCCRMVLSTMHAADILAFPGLEIVTDALLRDITSFAKSLHKNASS